MALAMPDAAPPRAAHAELDRAGLVLCRARDPRAFHAFVRRYERPVFACLSRMLGRGPHIEDLAQEAFLRAFRAFPTFDPDGAAKPSTWLLTIAVHLALDARKRRVIPLRPLDDATRVAGHGTPESENVRAQIGRLIERAADQLPDDQRAAFVPPSTTASRWARCRRDGRARGHGEDAASGARATARHPRRRVEGHVTIDSARLGAARADAGLRRPRPRRRSRTSPESPARASPRRARGVRILAGAGLAFAAGSAIAIGMHAMRAPDHGDVLATKRIEVHLGNRAIAVLERGAHVSWTGDQVSQPAGDVFYRVEPGRAFDVHTPRATSRCWARASR